MFFPIGRDAYDTALWGMDRAERQVLRGARRIARGDLDPGAFVVNMARYLGEVKRDDLWVWAAMQG